MPATLQKQYICSIPLSPSISLFSFSSCLSRFFRFFTKFDYNRIINHRKTNSIEQRNAIELSLVSSSSSSFPHVSVAATAMQESDTIDGVGTSATTEYEFLTGFRLWSLIIAIMLSMLLLGLDINIVATVSVLCSNYSLPTVVRWLLLTKVLSGYSHYFQCIPQYRGY